MVLCQIWISKLLSRAWLLRWVPTVLFYKFYLLDQICYYLTVRTWILDTIVCSGALLWLFSSAWDTVELTLKVGFICLFAVIDPNNLGVSIEVAKALWMSIYTRHRIPALLPIIKKAKVCMILLLFSSLFSNKQIITRVRGPLLQPEVHAVQVAIVNLEAADTAALQRSTLLDCFNQHQGG